MNITLKSKPLIEAIKSASAAMCSRTTLPVLGCVFVEGGADGVRVTCDNLDARLTVRVEGGESSKPFAFIAAPRLLIASLRGDEAQIKIEKERITVESGGRTVLSTLPVEEFPPAPEAIETKPVDGEQLASCIRAVILSASTNETRLVMNSVYLSGGEMAATDGKQLQLAPCEAPAPNPIIIPTALAHLILSEFSDGGSLEMGSRGSKFRIQNGSAVLTGKLIEGKFPNYKQVIPQESRVVVKLNRSDLQAALSSLLDFTHRDTDKVIITPESGSWKITANNDSHESSVSVPCEGEKLEKFAISCRRLISLLKGWDSDEVTVDMLDAISPLLIKPVGEPGRLGVLAMMRG